MYSLLDSAVLAGADPETYLSKAARAALDDELIPLPHELVDAEQSATVG